MIHDPCVIWFMDFQPTKSRPVRGIRQKTHFTRLPFCRLANPSRRVTVSPRRATNTGMHWIALITFCEEINLARPNYSGGQPTQSAGRLDEKISFKTPSVFMFVIRDEVHISSFYSSPVTLTVTVLSTLRTDCIVRKGGF